MEKLDNIELACGDLSCMLDGYRLGYRYFVDISSFVGPRIHHTYCCGFLVTKAL